MSILPQAFLDLASTIVVECGILACLMAGKRLQPAVDLAWVNLLTNPLAHLALLLGAGFWPIELGVILSEVCLFRVLIAPSWARAAGLSVLLNGATIAISLWAS